VTALSIVIPSHNRADLLRLCLASVVQHAPPGTEVLVVDDASPAGAVSAVAATFGVRCLRLPRQRGFCAAVNVGIRATAGVVVELLNDDTEVVAGWAEAALAHFEEESVAAVAPLVLCWPEGERVDSAGDRYYLGGIAAKRGHGERLSDEYLQPRAVFGASGSSAFYRCAALLHVGAFPESFGAYFEDVDLAFRLQRAGYRAIYEPAARVLHRVSASQVGRPRRLLEQQSCNEERVFWRNVPGRLLARALPRHLAVLAAKAWCRWREGTLAPFLCGRLRLLGEVPALLRHRRQLRALGAGEDVENWHLEECYWDTPQSPRLAACGPGRPKLPPR
jgi:GT2 family glycosyltransferase